MLLKAGLPLGLACCLAASACVPMGAPEDAGDIGLFVTQGGELWAEVAVCSGYVDGLSLWPLHEEDADNLIDLDLEPRARQHRSVRLGDLEGEERIPMRTGVPYLVSAGSNDFRWSMDSGDFDVADLRDLEPGQILTSEAWGMNRIVTMEPEAWAKSACDDFRNHQ